MEHLFLSASGQCDYVVQIVTFPESIPVRVVAVRKFENLLQNFHVVRNVKGIPGLGIIEKIIKIVEPCPGDCRQAQGTGFVGGEKQAIACFWTVRCWYIVERI